MIVDYVNITILLYFGDSIILKQVKYCISETVINGEVYFIDPIIIGKGAKYVCR